MKTNQLCFFTEKNENLRGFFKILENTNYKQIENYLFEKLYNINPEVFHQYKGGDCNGTDSCRRKRCR